MVPSVVLILLSLIGSTALFAGGSYLASRWLLEQQVSHEADDVIKALDQRVAALSGAGQVLASDVDVIRGLQQTSNTVGGVLNGRAQAVQERFDLALVQIYGDSGRAWADLVLSSMCIDTSVTSSLLNMAEPGTPVARVVDGHLLLLGRAPIEEAGTVVVGIDLETELKQMQSGDRLSADLGLTVRGTNVGTGDGLPFDAQAGWVDDQYCRTRAITLGATPAELLLVHPGSGIGSGRLHAGRVTRAALFAMVGSTLFAALLLCGVTVTVIRSVERPIRIVSAAAEAVGQGDLEQKVQLAPSPLTIGEGDELGLLVDAFNGMTDNLRDRYADLEARVESRSVGLSIAAEVAQAVSSSLELDVILRQSAEIIKRRLGRVCPGVYHVGVFLVEEGSDIVVLREVASDARDDLARGSIRVPAGSKSPVGLAVATERSMTIQNVKVTSTHLKPPLLMDTYSAVAVPLLIGDRLIGALDVQSRQASAFRSDAIQLINTLANQIAIAVHNARLYGQQCQAAEYMAALDQLNKVMSHDTV
jgi:putative methionine-R-sulfoxide reductase with GAF domain/HAMP domain-containing protein